MKHEQAWRLAVDLAQPNYETLKAWRRRGLPWRVKAEAMDHCIENGVPVRLADFDVQRV